MRTNMWDSASFGTLIIEARRAGVDLWPGDRITYQGQPGVVRLVMVESRLTIRPAKAGEVGTVAAQKSNDVLYYLTLDNGECPAQVPMSMVRKAE